MVLPKSKTAVGLGNSLMNDRFGRDSGGDRKKSSHTSNRSGGGGIPRKGPDGETYVTNAASEASWVKMRSVTEQAALDEFLATAELAGTDFTAQKQASVKILHADQTNPYLLSGADERGRRRKQGKNQARLTVPRRPAWDDTTTPAELDRMERGSLLEWRRGLADMQEDDDLLMTPFERNIEVWRQLWRVIERSDLVVQIVDARNPLLFRCEDLEKYVQEVGSKKRNLLLVNKADMMTEEQRQIWASYFAEKGIHYRFFSAQLAKEQNEEEAGSGSSGGDSDGEVQAAGEEDSARKHSDPAESGEISGEEDSDSKSSSSDSSSSKTQILTVDELESLFLESSHAHPSSNSSTPSKTTIGLVGYPNVGKSSTINALIGAKKVSVSATPGKTKHFQTIHLSERVILCDCPGLVFPNFATTKAELVCNGILPIDQLREFTGPAGLVAQRIPQTFLEAVYGIKIQTRPPEEGGTGTPTASELLRAYAKARGFATTGQGQPDESRAARYVLKDYVSGKLLFCHPPPKDPEIDGKEFNREMYDFGHLPAKRQAWLLSHNDGAINDDDREQNEHDSEASHPAIPIRGPVEHGARSKGLDSRFFSSDSSNNGRLRMPFNHQYSEQGSKELSGRKLRTMTALESNMDAKDMRASGKKHFKGNKRKGKGKAVEDD